MFLSTFIIVGYLVHRLPYLDYRVAGDYCSCSACCGYGCYCLACFHLLFSGPWYCLGLCLDEVAVIAHQHQLAVAEY